MFANAQGVERTRFQAAMQQLTAPDIDAMLR